MEKRIYGVSELTREIRGLLEGKWPRLLVRGEISSLSRPGSGHLYFTLKDDRSQIACAFFKAQAVRCPFDLEEGQEVVILGRISVYEPRGSYQLIADAVEPVGQGALQLAFEQLKAKLEAEGLFDPAHKKTLPYLPKGIGIITSPTGAAIQDLLIILARRFPAVPILLYPSLVQGEGAAVMLTQAVKDLQGYQDQIDLIILGRGGGSLEDLWAFNDENLARAIFASTIPVISAVGHETDFTICDLVADLRAPTPSAAAELAVPNRADLLEGLAQLTRRLGLGWERKFNQTKQKLVGLERRLKSPQAVIEARAQRVDELGTRARRALLGRIGQVKHQLLLAENRLLFHHPKSRLTLSQERLGQLDRRLTQSAQLILEQKRQHLKEVSHVLQSVSPLSTLARGFSATKDQAGQLLKSVKQAKLGQKVEVHLTDGTLEAEIKGIKPGK